MSARDVERDALTYLEALYDGRPDGSLIAITQKTNGRWPSHFVRSPDDALPYVLGQVDVYARVTPLRELPPRGKRGEAALAASLHGVWADIDVNGSPKTSGGVVTGCAPSLEAAQELAHAVLEPSIGVCSGFGGQFYWLLEQPLVIANQVDYEAATALEHGWLERLRREARELGIDKLDPTQDLARVLRPPSSFNGKGATPMPVYLLDDGAKRYTLEQLREHVLVVESSVATTTEAPIPSERVEALLAEHKTLERYSARTGTAPGDGTPSAWDWALGCTAARKGASDDEVAALIRHARRRHGESKGERDDYVAMTVAKVHAEVHGKPTASKRKSDALAGDPDEGAPPEHVAAWISRALWLASDPIIGAERFGSGDDAVVWLRRRSGKRVRIPRQADLFNGETLSRRVVDQTGSSIPLYGKPDALRIARQVIRLCELEEADDERDETREWIDGFVASIGCVLHVELDTPDGLWQALGKQRAWKPPDDEKRSERRTVAERAAAMRDERGRLHLPAEALAEHVRRTVGTSISWPHLRARMRELGWERRRLQRWEPDAPRTTAGHREGVFYAEPIDGSVAARRPRGNIGAAMRRALERGEP